MRRMAQRREETAQTTRRYSTDAGQIPRRAETDRYGSERKQAAMTAVFRKSLMEGKYYGYYEQSGTPASLGSLAFLHACKNKRCPDAGEIFEESRGW